MAVTFLIGVIIPLRKMLVYSVKVCEHYLIFSKLYMLAVETTYYRLVV